MSLPVLPHHQTAAAAGAECSRCPLHGCGRGPVPPSYRPNAAGRLPFLVVGEAPGVSEVDQGATMVGPTGREVREALRAGGLDPAEASYTNAILCRPENGDLDGLLRECRRKGLPSPVDCCKPRLDRELAAADFKLYIGGASLRAVGAGRSIIEMRGTPIGSDALATLHPAFVLRDSGRVMRGVFRFDVAKAVRLARGGNTWRVPRVLMIDGNVPNPSCDDPYRLGWLDEMARNGLVSVDTETDAIDPWTCRLRRIGFYGRTSDGEEVAVIYAPLSVRGHYLLADWFRAEAEQRLRFFLSKAHRWVFHNYFGYDSIVLNQHRMPVREDNLFDSLVGHHVGPTSEYPHGLDFLGSIYTDSPYWKGGVEHTNTKSDEALNTYLASDVKVTHDAAPHVIASIMQSDQKAIYDLDARLSAVGRQMSEVGILIDQRKQVELAVAYQAKANRMRAEFVEAAGKDVNPASPVQLKDLLYHRFGLPVLEENLTETGEPSTAEPVLLSLLEMGVEPRVRRVIHALLGWREADKLISTYTGRIEGGKLVDGPRIHADGRLRTTWKVYGTMSGRWSSGSPMNLQNIPKDLRAMFVPAPGNVFVGADFSALELRIQALVAADSILIEAFRAFDAGTGPDIHKVNGATIFKTTPEKIEGEPRTFAKRFVYSLQYDARPPRIFQTLSLLRDAEFRPVFGTITLQEVEHAYKVWWAAHPEIVAWRRGIRSGFRRLGYVATPWHGRRRYMLGGEDEGEMYSHVIQGGGADLQNSAVLRIVEQYGFGPAKGLILQIHDQNVVECPEGEAERVKKIVQESMERTIGAMSFPAEAKIGKNWKAVS